MCLTAHHRATFLLFRQGHIILFLFIIFLQNLKFWRKFMNIISLKKGLRRIKKINVRTFLINNKLLIFLSMFLLIGIFLGAILLKYADGGVMRLINVLFLSDFKKRFSKTLLEVFITSISSTFIFVIISFFIGLSMWGFILAPIIPLIRGICIGLTESYLYSAYGLKGIIFHTLIFLPGIFISSVAVLLMARESMKTSNHFSSMIFLKDRSEVVRNGIKLYMIRSGCIAIIVLISSAVDVVSSFLFSKMTPFFGV